jgi:hypothetical protein
MHARAAALVRYPHPGGGYSREVVPSASWLQRRAGLEAAGTLDRATLERLLPAPDAPEPPSGFLRRHALTRADIGGPYRETPDDAMAGFTNAIGTVWIGLSDERFGTDRIEAGIEVSFVGTKSADIESVCRYRVTQSASATVGGGASRSTRRSGGGTG